MSEAVVYSQTWTFSSSGECIYCGQRCTRTRSFTATRYEDAQYKADRWVRAGLWHKKCGLS